MKLLTIGFLAITTLLFNTSLFAACPVGNVTLSTQNQVNNFAVTYAGCTTLPSGVKLKIKGANITNLNGLSVLTQIDGNLEIEWCPALVDVTGLWGITTVNGVLQFEECHALTNLNGLQNLSSCHDLDIRGMDALTDISQLSGLTSLSGELRIKDCDALTTLAGLDNITSIGGDFRIDENANLTDLTALSNLTSIGGDAGIVGNKNLTNLDGLDNITFVGRDLDIKDNPALTDCIGACKMSDGVIAPYVVRMNNNNSLQCNDITTFEGDCLVALPVELTDFRAKEDAKNQTVVLSWSTASEINNKHFEIERTVDGRNFETIGIVAGNGTTTKTYNYNFVDQQPVSMAYYRLKQVDFSNSFTYSNLVLVEMSNKEAAQVAAFPTLAQSEITIRFTGFEAQMGTFSVFNAQGRLVHIEDVDLSNKSAYLPLNVSNYANGIYTIVIANNSKITSTNFVVVK